MGIKSFRGGVHPPENKAVSPDSEVLSVKPASNSVWIPITQGGVPNELLVKVGDQVARGQKIAETDKFMSAPVHSSVSGTVKKIEPHLVTGNTENPCVLIQIDEENREEFMTSLDPFTCSHEEALKRIREAGITGMGGASFPTHVKLSPPPGTKIDYVIANGAECEPYLCTDAAAMYAYADAIVDGLIITMHISNAEKGVIAIEDNKKSLVPVLEKAVEKARAANEGKNTNIIVQLCKTKYPQGGEKTLTDAAVGREIPSGGLPFQIGCIIQNVGTLKAISEAFRLGKPLIDRALTLGGGACEKPVNITAPIGTCIGDLIPSVIQLKPGVMKIISGGPMMGQALFTLDIPVTKSSSSITTFVEDEVEENPETPCIKCGRCIDVCPSFLVPVLMMDKALNDDTEGFEKLNGMECVECGSCAYVCPAKRPLTQGFKYMRQAVAAKRRAEAAKKEGK